MSAQSLFVSGIKVLYENFEDNVDSVGQGIDIVAIHGIGADPDTTWSGKGPTGERVNWLVDSTMLPKAVPNARIMRFGYKSNWFGSRKNEPQNTHPPKKTLVSQVADMLLRDLEYYRRGITRPIIFIAHSYGGLVLIHAIRSSFENRAEWLDPFGHTVGLVFFGTPFRGRRGLSLQQMVEAIAQSNPDIDIYPETMALSVEENPYLDDLVNRFTTARLKYPIPIWCFYETEPSPVSRVLGNGDLRDGYIVPQNSACLDTSLGIERAPLERHHYNLQKFSGPEDKGYITVEKAIVNLVQGAESFMKNSLERENAQKQDQKSPEELKLLAILAAGHDHEKSKNFNPPKVKNTCEWFLEDTTFRSWRDSVESSFLWVSAGPGCGKSVLSRSLIDEGQLSTSDTSIVCYYFFKDGDETRQRSANAISAILHQLLIQDPTRKFVALALKRYENYGKALSTNFSELWNLLLECAATPGAGEIVCALDALDECREEDRNIIINKLREFFSDTGRVSSRLCRLKFFVTSRPYDTIERSIGRFLSSFCLRLDGDSYSTAINGDIDRVIDHEIPKQMSHFTKDNQRRISERLKAIRNRTYLWLRLTFYIINRKPSHYAKLSDVEALLDSIPDEHAKAYEEILNRSNTNCITRVIFQLMLAAKEPLSVDEANYALTLATAEPPFVSLPLLKDRLWDTENFISTAKNLCGLLVDFHDSKLSFIHQTVREFLTDCPQGHGTWNWRGRFKLPECHAAISRSCIHYLPLMESDDQNTSEVTHPFLSYAKFYWPLHYREQDNKRGNNLLKEARNLCRIFSRRMNVKSRRAGAEWNMTELCFAAKHGLTQVVRAILDEDGVDIDEYCTDCGTALCAASEAGYADVVEILLDAGADVNADTGLADAPVMIALRLDRKAVLNVLFQKRREQDVVTEALMIKVASRWNGRKFMPLLLERCKEPVQVTEAVMVAAAKEGMVKTLEFLLEKQGKQAQITEAVIVAAAKEGSPNTLSWLLEKGGQVQITEAIMVEVAKNRFGKEILTSFFEKYKEQAQVTEAVIVAAAEEGWPNTLSWLLEKGEQAQITEAVMVAVAKRWPEHILALLRNWEEQVQVTEAVVVAAAGNDSFGKEIIALFMKAGKQVRASEPVLAAARWNKYCGKEIIALLEEAEKFAGSGF
ncbi:hypothetical protein F5X98DRAFT_390791 [Xylaria grammica]|nr:hypothetical protein F5X98DRAFT_390791 [Xylaria grammica]